MPSSSAVLTAALLLGVLPPAAAQAGAPDVISPVRGAQQDCAVPGLDDRCERWFAAVRSAPIETDVVDMVASPDGATDYVMGVEASTGGWRIVAVDVVTGATRWDRAIQEPGSAEVADVGTTNRDHGGDLFHRDAAVTGALLVSADGSRLFAVGSADEAGTVVALDSGTGETIWTQADLSEGSFVDGELSPDGSTLYAVDEWSLTIVAVDTASGEVGWRTAVDIPGSRAYDLAVSPVGDSVFVVGDIESGADLLAVVLGFEAASGAHLWESTFHTQTPGQPDEYGWDWFKESALSPDGQTLFATGATWFPDPIQEDLGIQRDRTEVLTVAYHAATGATQWVSRARGGSDGWGNFGTGIAVAPAGDRLFVGGSLTSEIARADRDIGIISLNAATGQTLWARRQGTPTAVETSTDVVVSQDGQNVYATGWSNTTSTIAVTISRITESVTAGFSTSDGRRLWSARFSDPVNQATWDRGDGIALAGRTIVVSVQLATSRRTAPVPVVNISRAEMGVLAYDAE